MATPFSFGGMKRSLWNMKTALPNEAAFGYEACLRHMRTLRFMA